jgi:endonuclease/exonuclease/phosphatase family metal-dependent hydrolase
VKKTLLALALAVSLADAQPMRAQSGEPLPLRIVHWNVFYDGQGTDGVRDRGRQVTKLAALDADVITLNEVTANATVDYAVRLERATGSRWNHHHASATKGGWGNAVLSRHPFVSTSVYRMKIGASRSIAQATLDVRGVRVNVFATHLDSGDRSQNRALQAKELLAFLNGFDGPRIFAGDMNAGPDAGELKPLSGAYEDAWMSAVHRGTARAYPANPPHRYTRTRRTRLDYIFTSRDLQTVGCEVPDLRDRSNTNVKTLLRTADDQGVRPSDHNLVSCAVALPDAPPPPPPDTDTPGDDPGDVDPPPTDPPGDTGGPVDPPADPVDPPADPVDPPADPVDPPADPVDPPADPVDPPADPVDPPEDPVDPPADTGGSGDPTGGDPEYPDGTDGAGDTGGDGQTDPTDTDDPGDGTGNPVEPPVDTCAVENTPEPVMDILTGLPQLPSPAALQVLGEAPLGTPAEVLDPLSPAPVTPIDEIVLRPAATAVLVGNWVIERDCTAAAGALVVNPDRDMPKARAEAVPLDYFDITFTADAGKPYRLWIRGKAARNNWKNDSVSVQFSGAVDALGQPVYRIGTEGRTIVTLEECISCGLAGWAWQDNGFGSGVLGPEIYFETSGPQTIRIQQREDGISIDQIVLSAATWLSLPPGPPKHDATIVPVK